MEVWCARAQRSRALRAATRCIARLYHPSMSIVLPSQERLLSHAMCPVESTSGVAAVLEKKCVSTPHGDTVRLPMLVMQARPEEPSRCGGCLACRCGLRPESRVNQPLAGSVSKQLG